MLGQQHSRRPANDQTDDDDPARQRGPDDKLIANRGCPTGTEGAPIRKKQVIQPQPRRRSRQRPPPRATARQKDRPPTATGDYPQLHDPPRLFTLDLGLSP